MKQRSSQSIELNLVKIVGLCLVVMVLFFLSYSTYLYSVVRDNRDIGINDTRSRLSETITEADIEAITRFHGDSYYHVVYTKQQEDAVYYFVDQIDEEAPVISHRIERAQPVEQIVSSFKSSRENVSIRHVNVGLRGSTPIVEIISKDTRGALRYDYYNLADGTYESGLTLKNNLE